MLSGFLPAGLFFWLSITSRNILNRSYTIKWTLESNERKESAACSLGLHSECVPGNVFQAQLQIAQYNGRTLGV